MNENNPYGSNRPNQFDPTNPNQNPQENPYANNNSGNIGPSGYQPSPQNGANPFGANPQPYNQPNQSYSQNQPYPQPYGNTGVPPAYGQAPPQNQNYGTPPSYSRQQGYQTMPGQPSWMPPVIVQQKKGSVAGKIFAILLTLAILGGVGFFFLQNTSLNLTGEVGLTDINDMIIGQQNSKLEQFLVNNPGADLNETNDSEYPPLYTAILEENQRAIVLLVEHGADINFDDPYGYASPLFCAAIEDNMEAARYLLESGALVNDTDHRGAVPMAKAIEHGTDFVNLFLEFGGDATAVNEDNRNMLHFAAYYGQQEVYELFLEKSVDEKALEDSGFNMAHMALYGGELSFLSYLQDRGFTLNTDTITSGDSLLHLASHNLETQKYVVENFPEIDVNVRNVLGETPLMFAIYAEDPEETVDFLLDMGADISLKDNDGNTAYDLAEYDLYLDDALLRKIEPQLAA